MRSMLPIRDVIPSRTTPWMTIGLVGINLLVLTAAFGEPPGTRQAAILELALAPGAPLWPAALTSLFTHASWLPAAGNVLALWLFGSTLEDRMGHVRFLVLYLAAGLAATVTWALAMPASAAPLAGADPAIAGIVMPYLFAFPQSRVLVLAPTARLSWNALEVPATVVVTVWLVLVGLGALATGRSTPSIGANLWHLAIGAAAGLIVWRLLRPDERRHADWWGA
jgi:membrane associated rhomboid family serine protease